MKNKKLIFLLSIALTLAFVSGVIYFKPPIAKSITKEENINDERIEKEKLEKLHDKLKTEHRKKSREKNQEYLELDAKSYDVDPPAHTELGIFDAEEIGVPGFHAFLNQFEFTNIIYTPYHMIVVGSYKDNPDNGVIYDMYTRPNKAEQKTELYTVDSVGKITLEDTEDFKSISFTTEKGNNGLIKIIGSKIKYEILN